MELKEWISNRRNIFSVAVPVIFILGVIFFRLGFVLGTIYGILAYHYRDYGKED